MTLEFVSRYVGKAAETDKGFSFSVHIKTSSETGLQSELRSCSDFPLCKARISAHNSLWFRGQLYKQVYREVAAGNKSVGSSQLLLVKQYLYLAQGLLQAFFVHFRLTQ